MPSEHVDSEGGQHNSDEDLRRVRFYGVNDLATGFHIPRVVELLEVFDPASPPTSISDILELHNVQKYLEHGLLPMTLSDEERAHAKLKIPEIRRAVAQFFVATDNTNFDRTVAGVSHEYHVDLLNLLAQHNVLERCDGATTLPALSAAGVHLGDMLANKKLVRTYDAELRTQLCGSPQGAEHLVRKHLQDDTGVDIYLPSSLTAGDARRLLESYIDSEHANPNYVGLIATAKENPRIGIDAKLKLRAKRRNDEITKKFFDENKGFMSGVEVGISADQEEPVVFEIDTSEGFVSKHTYSSQWLDETCDNPSILNNFVYLFEFVDRQSLLVLPSYPANLGVMERVIGTHGRTEYRVGAAFQAVDRSTLLQTHLYYRFLETKGIDLEHVFAWFFEEYLVEEFGALNFTFTPSSPGSSYLQKVRHLFAEMESVANQFVLFAQDGELDRDLLSMGSTQVRYRAIPSLLEGNYVYSSDSAEIASVLHLMFSDQSTLTYINEDLKADNTASLLLTNTIMYDDFKDYQKPALDYLIELNVLEDAGTRIQLADVERFIILRALFTTQAASYYRLSPAGRAEADALVAKGWATRSSSLLTQAEGKYFNYNLNSVDFSNGPALRNKYLHGSQATGDGEDAHYNAYITGLRLTVALIIKMNEDFCLSAIEKAGSGGA
jgi:hypothetical protein